MLADHKTSAAVILEREKLENSLVTWPHGIMQDWLHALSDATIFLTHSSCASVQSLSQALAEKVIKAR
jgi:predicted subunit of tRNA(5-methylaminomethyl-2-thiouridylate) methyltransferase